MAVTEEIAEQLNENARILKVVLNQLQVDLSYQRNPSRAIIDQIARDWDIVASELILVSDRGDRPEDGPVQGGLFIINGQHRTLAARQRGLQRIEARVIDLSGFDDPARIEAALRLKTNVRLKDNSLERFKAQLRAGDEDSIAIQKILAGFDTEINAVANAEFGINCVSCIESIYQQDQGALLRELLEVMKAAYGEIRGQYANANLFKAISWFLIANPTGDRGRLVSRLQALQAPALMARARTHASVMGKALWFNVYRTIIEIYNEKLSTNRLEVVSRGATRLSQSSGQAFR